MNTVYVIYDTITGIADGLYTGPSNTVNAQLSEGQSYIHGVFSFTKNYVDITQDPPVIADRLPFPGTQNTSQIQANGTDEWVVLNIPVGSIVTWPDGVISTINDGILQFTVDLAGTYSFVFDSFPYLLEEVSIEAVT